jgi:DNA-binding GntR family transcriptional regulator
LNGLGQSTNALLAEQVHARLRAYILLARLRPGEPMSENQLAQRLGVSRTPVREAIQRLVREGLVNVWPQRGSLVSLMSLQRIQDALFVR